MLLGELSGVLGQLQIGPRFVLQTRFGERGDGFRVVPFFESDAPTVVGDGLFQIVRGRRFQGLELFRGVLDVPGFQELFDVREAGFELGFGIRPGRQTEQQSAQAQGFRKRRGRASHFTSSS
jgi:hypothetical protein